MTEHAVVIAGGGPTRLMLAGELALQNHIDRILAAWVGESPELMLPSRSALAAHPQRPR